MKERIENRLDLDSSCMRFRFESRSNTVHIWNPTSFSFLWFFITRAYVCAGGRSENCISRKKRQKSSHAAKKHKNCCRRKTRKSVDSNIAHTCLMLVQFSLFHSGVFLMCTRKTHRLILIYLQPLWKNSYNAESCTQEPPEGMDGCCIAFYPITPSWRSKCHGEKTACICIFILFRWGL